MAGSCVPLPLGYLSALFQGVRALASTLTSNLYIKRLDLRDNGLCGAGAEALANVLCKNSIISETTESPWQGP